MKNLKNKRGQKEIGASRDCRWQVAGGRYSTKTHGLRLMSSCGRLARALEVKYD